MTYIYIIVSIAAYLLGSVNSSIIVGKLWKNVDIRRLGSGNAGATNTLRNLGLGPAIAVVAGDALKGIIAVAFGSLLAGYNGALLGGLGAVIGHNWPVFFQFKGGKGILTSAVVIIAVTPKIGIIVVGVSILLMAVTRYVSIGSLFGALLYPVLVVVFFFENTYLFMFSLLLASLAVFRHRGNIQRLLKGTESKLGSKKS